MFGVSELLAGAARQHACVCSEEQLRSILPRPGQILLISGPSGAGKTSLLRALHRLSRQTTQWIDFGALQLPDKPVIDCFEKLPIISALRLLSRVGLAEAWSYFKTPDQLSEGQRWRLRLALAMAGAKPASGRRVAREDRQIIIACDEFAAILDRVSILLNRAYRAIYVVSRGGGAVEFVSVEEVSKHDY